MSVSISLRPKRAFLSLVLMVFGLSATAFSQESARQKEAYSKIRSFTLASGSIDVKDLILKKDRVQMVLTGTIYLAVPVDGRVTGAVFMGAGKLSVETPPSDFEKANVKRLLGGSETIESDFNSAVFRFTDDTDRAFGQLKPESAVNVRAQKKATEHEARILKETGANLAARISLAFDNAEKPGFFFATFEGGKRGRFSYVFDPQCRIPVANFGIDGGEKGLVWTYQAHLYGNEVWLAFYALEDYQRGQVEYSAAHDLIDIENFGMQVDLRNHKKYVRISTRISAQSLQPNLKVLTFMLGEGLGEFEDQRLTKQLRTKSARIGETDLAFAQEDWESGLTVFLNEPLKAGQKVALDLELEGDFMYDSKSVDDCHYPRSSTSWLPRHSHLDRATFDITFKHPKRLLIASIGSRLSEEIDPADKDVLVTRYQMNIPVPLVTFALAPFQRHKDTIKWEKGGAPTPLEFNSLPGSYAAIKEDFIIAEMNNAVRYFTALFGDYPYPTFGGAFHPFGFGQGFPTLLMIPAADSATKGTHAFIAHETAHQWWGNIVAWRSYRDQWLSEGFAEYSGILYTGLRMNRDAKSELLSMLRSSLKEPPQSDWGQGKGRLVDVGPIILGHRLSTRKTQDAYQTLIYNKGALVLRMLHFMLSNPKTGDTVGFFDMMTDFVNRYRNKTASTDDFRLVANEHFAKTQIARVHGLSDLNFLFRQFVYQTDLPSYELQYKIEDLPDGKVMLSGTIVQQNAPADWMMVLPVKLTFGEKQEGVGTVLVEGPSSPFQMKLPVRPRKVELDPDRWILSERTSTKGS